MIEDTVWKGKFLRGLEGKSIAEVTKVVDYCYSRCNSLSKNYTDGKGQERLLWKEKARLAVEVRKKLKEGNK